jgi:hypothetical protein
VLVLVEALAFPVPLTAPGREDKARHYKLIELGIAASDLVAKIDSVNLSEPRPKMMPADQSAPERQECLVYVGSPFVANAQAPELKQPSKGSFYHPPQSAQSTGMLGVAFGKERHDVPSKQTSPDLFRVIAPVA